MDRLQYQKAKLHSGLAGVVRSKQPSTANDTAQRAPGTLSSHVYN